MNQQEWLNQIPFYINGTLKEQERRQFDQYLTENPDNTVYIDQWREIAEATVLLVQPATIRLPPISKAVRDSLQTAPVNPLLRLNDNDSHQQETQPHVRMIPSPAQAVVRSTPKQKYHETAFRYSHDPVAIGTGITLAAAILVMVSVGILWALLNRSTSDDLTTVALISTVSGTVVGGDTGAPVIATPINELPPTSVFSPTATPFVEAAPPSLIPTDLPPVGFGGGGQTIITPLNTPSATGVVEQPDISVAQLLPMVSPTFQQRNCYVVNESGTPLNIFQFAKSSSDVIGVMNPGQRYDTWIHTGKNVDEPFYQVFLPQSRENRTGWVFATQVNLYGPDGTVCNVLLEPTPTNSVFPGNRPTPVPANICRVSNSTGGDLPVYLIPDDNSSALMYLLPVGDLLIAKRIYRDGWYQVIISGVGFGWIQQGSVVANGACSTLPIAIDYVLPTPTPTPIQ